MLTNVAVDMPQKNTAETNGVTNMMLENIVKSMAVQH